MCSISGSFSKQKIKDLYRINAYRGEMNYSVTTFEYDSSWNRTRVGTVFQDEGGLQDFIIDNQQESEVKYFLTHSQAPTTEVSSIHPATYSGALLWHNGIIKQSTIPSGTWDTEWLLKQILDYGWSSLSRVNGSFACIMYNAGMLYAFRNEISPLFIDDELNISSTKFPHSRSLQPNQVWVLDILSKTYRSVAEFETFENPYFFA